MTTIRIGQRRLFEAVESSISGKDRIRTEKQLPNGLFIIVSIGPEPIFGKMVSSGRAKYTTRNPAGWNMGPHEPLSNPPHGCYTEIICYEELEISDEEFAKLEAGDIVLRDKYLSQAQSKSEKYLKVINWFGGVIGIRLHRLFVTEPITDNCFICKQDMYNLGMPVMGLVLENINPITLNESGISLFEQLPSIFPNTDEALVRFGTAFEWLLRAWTVRDSIERFMALFIPLEIMLNNSNIGFKPSNKELIDELGKSVQDSKLLKEVKDRIQYWRPPLAIRFEFLAEKYALDGWKQDVKAFRKFNKMRNDLFHGHSTRVVELVDVPLDEQELEGESSEKIDEKVTAKLEDMVERYLCKAIFGDQNLYLSFWRSRKAT